MENSEHVKKEYPSLDGTTCNCRLACEVARSQAAELNAISEYLYQSIMFRETMPGLSDMFDGIALDEMHHFRMLGELINRLGGDPTVRTAVRGRGGICLREDKDSRAPVAAQVRAILPVFCGISGSTKTIFKVATALNPAFNKLAAAQQLHTAKPGRNKGAIALFQMHAAQLGLPL